MRHHTLAEILNALTRTGLAIEHMAETGERAVPHTLALRAVHVRHRGTPA